jgi:hypothetical protein
VLAIPAKIVLFIAPPTEPELEALRVGTKWAGEIGNFLRMCP